MVLSDFLYGFKWLCILTALEQLYAVSCPAETAEVMFKPDETNPFSLDKEFNRQVMNVYRYSLQTRNDGTAKGGCNAYIVPSIQKACYNVRGICATGGYRIIFFDHI